MGELKAEEIEVKKQKEKKIGPTRIESGYTVEFLEALSIIRRQEHHWIVKCTYSALNIYPWKV